jgi:phage replication-related protein YjqB (UPF0714/DUF867 family)
MHVITNDNPVNGSHGNNIANKTKTKHFEYVCFSNNKRDFATDDNIRYKEVIE